MTECCPRGVVGLGNVGPGIVFIGIEPGETEIRVGKPFQGESGRLLNMVLGAVGWKRDWCFCTNLCCQYTGGHPTMMQLAVCRPRLLKELTAARPRLIVTLGALACEEIFDQPFSRVRGAILQPDALKHLPVGAAFGGAACYGLATYHPAAVLRAETPELQNDFAGSLVRDLKKVMYFFGPGRAPAAPVVALPQVITTPERAQALLDHLPRIDFSELMSGIKQIPVVLDVETDYDKETAKADPFARSSITCVGIGLPGDVQYVLERSALTWPGPEGPSLRWPKDVLWTGHNMYGFDSIAMRQEFGAIIPIYRDTMIGSYTLDERTTTGPSSTAARSPATVGLHKLKSNAREWVGADFWEPPLGKNVAALTPQERAVYNGKDVAYTGRLDKWQQQHFDELDKKLYYELLIPAANVLCAAQYDGVTIDVRRAFELGASYIKRIRASERELQRMACELSGRGEYAEMNVNSTQQIGRFLYSDLHLPVLEYTATGAASTKKDVLQGLDHPWVDMLQLHRQLVKTKATYIDNPMAQIKHDGRVHPKAWIPGTVTGRLSYTDPPVHNLPHARTIGDLSEVRSIFRADTEDDCLMEIDYNQIEIHIAQAFSGDEAMYDDLRLPYYVDYQMGTPLYGQPNYHSRIAQAVIGAVDDGSVAWKFARDNAKHVTFGIMYGETAWGLATKKPPQGLGCDVRVAGEYINTWYQRNNQFWRWQRSVEFAIRETGRVFTPFGRKRRMPIILNAKQLRQIINFSIQSVAGDYTLSSMVELAPLIANYGWRVLWLTHDALLLHGPRKYVQVVRELVTQIMQRPRLEGFPSVPVEASVGFNLYEVSP